MGLRYIFVLLYTIQSVNQGIPASSSNSSNPNRSQHRPKVCILDFRPSFIYLFIYLFIYILA